MLMAPNQSGTSAGSSYFEQQRGLLLQDIGEVWLSHIIAFVHDYCTESLPQNLEQVLQNLNRLNRNLEGVIAVCLSLNVHG